MTHRDGFVTFGRRNRLDPDALEGRTEQTGMLWISLRAWEVMGKPERVSFKVDRERRALAICPMQGEYSVKVLLANQTHNQSAVGIRALAPLRYLDVTQDELLRLYHLQFEDGMLILELGGEAATE